LALGKQYSADLVEMESYWIGRIAADRKLPFLEARSIFDSVRDDLSLLTQILSEGRRNPVLAAANCILHPEGIRTLAYYAGNSKKAARGLAVFVSRLIKEI
jgi:hypothetical protein